MSVSLNRDCGYVEGLLAGLEGFYRSMAYRGMAVASFDESGKLNDSEIVAFGGCVMLGTSVNDFTQRWEQRLKSDRLSHTSMKEAVNLQGPYEKWKGTPELRDAVVRDLAALLLDAPALRIVSPITRGSFISLSQDFRKRMGNDPHYAGFEACVIGALRSRLDVGLFINCDLSEEYSEKIIKLFHRLRRLNPDVKDRCVGIGFADDEVNGPLQAADMIAYCARAHAIRDSVPPQLIVAELIELLRSQGVEEHSVLYEVNGKGLGEGRFEATVQ